MGFPVGTWGIGLRVANPASYLAQKLLVLPHRKPDKQAKDVLYVHDTLLMFAGGLERVAEMWNLVASSLHANVRKAVDKRREDLFLSVTDCVRRASIIAASTGRPDPPSPERLIATCRLGLDRVFGPRAPIEP